MTTVEKDDDERDLGEHVFHGGPARWVDPAHDRADHETHLDQRQDVRDHVPPESRFEDMAQEEQGAAGG